MRCATVPSAYCRRRTYAHFQGKAIQLDEVEVRPHSCHANPSPTANKAAGPVNVAPEVAVSLSPNVRRKAKQRPSLVLNKVWKPRGRGRGGG